MPQHDIDNWKNIKHNYKPNRDTSSTYLKTDYWHIAEARLCAHYPLNHDYCVSRLAQASLQLTSYKSRFFLSNAVSKLTSFSFPASQVPHLATPTPLTWAYLNYCTNASGCAFLSKHGRKLYTQSVDDRETSFLFQRLSVLIQRFSDILLLNSFVKEEEE